MKLADAKDVRVGSVKAKAVYAGTVKDWPSWTPATFAGLNIWLDASQLALADGAAVNPWPNLGNPAIPGTMYGTPSPVVRNGALNGLPVVRFSALQGRLRMTGTGITKDYTVVYVGRMWSLNAGARFLSTVYQPGPGINFLLGYYGTNQDVAYDGPAGFWTPTVTKPADTTWRMYSGDGASASYNPRLFRNGVLMSTASAGGAGWGERLNISGYAEHGTDEVGDVEIAELCFYNRKLSDADRQTVESYLRTKWGL